MDIIERDVLLHSLSQLSSVAKNLTLFSKIRGHFKIQEDLLLKNKIHTSVSAICLRIPINSGVQLNYVQLTCPLFKGNISVADCMPLSSLLSTITSSSAVAKRPRDASGLSVVRFNSIKRGTESFIVSYVQQSTVPQSGHALLTQVGSMYS